MSKRKRLRGAIKWYDECISDLERGTIARVKEEMIRRRGNAAIKLARLVKTKEGAEQPTPAVP